MCGGGTQTTTTKTEIPPEVLARYNAVNARAEEAAKTPFQPYTGEFVAGITPTQQAGIEATNQYSQTAQPFFGAGAGLTMQGSRSIGPLTQGQIGYYQNPYTQYVAGATEAALRQQQGQQLSQQQAEAIKGGAFGGDRAGLQRAVLQGQQGLATAQALAPIYSQGYQQAVQTAQGQQGVVGQDLARQLQAGQQIAGLGTGAQAAALQGAQAQMQAGTLQQQTQQAQDTAVYQQFLQQRGYPFQVAQFLANIAEGTGALSGNTQTQTAPAPFFSDKRLKHDAEKVGEMHDGTPIYRFKYNGSDHTQIGLMAQDVEKRHPEAVGESQGYKTVDYKRATDEAAHKADGGGIMPNWMGGAVHEAGHYAAGGLADADLSALLAQQSKSFGPFGQGGLYGGSAQANPYSAQGGGQSGYVPAGNLHVPKMLTASPMAAPKQTSTASELYSNLKSLDSIASDVTGKGLFQRGRDATGMGEQSRPAQGTTQNQTAPAQAPVQKTSTDPEDPTGLGRARGGLVPRAHYLGGGPIIPGAPDSNDNPGSESGAQGDVLDKVVKEGAAEAPKQLQQPNSPPPSSSSQGSNPLGMVASGISAAKGLGSIGSGISSLAGGLGAGAEAAGAAAGAAGAAGGIGSALGSIGTGVAQVLPFLAMLSDERMKHNKRVVGKLYDGQPVYSFDYGDGRTQIGLMAQNVEHKHPEAVAETQGGLKMVDYHRATEHAAHKGHFAKGGLARAGFLKGGPTDEDTTDTGDTAMPVDTSGSRAKDYYDYLTAKKGVEPHVAAGMLGNAFHESGGLQHNILGDQGNSYGLFQYNNRGEMPAFKQWAEANGRSVRDPYAQLDFTHERLTSGPYQNVYDKMRGAQSAGEAAGHFMTGYERPKAETAALGSRMSYADTISQGAFDKLKNVPAQQAISAQMQGRPAPQQERGLISGAVQDTGNFLSRNKDIIIPVLQGLGAMASSPSRYLGSAILQGLGAGAKGYADYQMLGAQTEAEKERVAQLQQASQQKDFVKMPDGSIGVLISDGKGGTKWITKGQWYAMGQPPTASQSRLSSGQGAGSSSAAPIVDVGATGAGANLPQNKTAVEDQLDAKTKSVADYNIERANRSGIEGLKADAISANPFDDAAALANAADANSHQTTMYAKSLSQLPTQMSGPLSSEILNPIISRIGNVAAIAGVPQEYIDKLAGATSAKEIQDKVGIMLQNAQRKGTAYQELETLRRAIPSDWNSKEGQAQLVSSILVNDHNYKLEDQYYRDYRRHFEEKSGYGPEWSKYSGSGLKRNWESSRAAQVQQDKKAIAEMFNATLYDKQGKSYLTTSDSQGNKLPATVLTYLIDNAGQIPDENVRKVLEKKYGTKNLERLTTYFSGGQ